MLGRRGVILLRSQALRRQADKSRVVSMPCARYLRGSLSQGQQWRSFGSGDSGNAAFKDLLKKMQSSGDVAEADKEKEEKKRAEAAPSSQASEHAEPVENGDLEDEKKEGDKEEEHTDEREGEGDRDEDDRGEEEEEDNKKEAEDGMKFEMPKFDAERAQAFVASLPGRYRLFADNFVVNVKEAFAELKGDDKKGKSLRTKVQQAASYRKASEVKKGDGDEEEEEEEAEPVDKGPSAMVHVKEPTSQWDVMRERLAASPLIRDILKGSKKAYKAAADTDLGHKVEDAGERVKEKLEDVKEFWETSQNPVVYAMSGIWDNVTGETEEGICLSEILKLDPSFEKEEWAHDVKTQLVPDVIKAHLTGDVDFLKQHLGEGVLNKLTQDIKLRESDKIEFDTNILDIDENATIMKFVEENGPVIVCVYMVQQINCIRKAGEIIEGSEEAVVAKFYSVAFTQEYLEDEGEVRWKVVDYEFGGETPYF